jgi:hypothetical protein
LQKKILLWFDVEDYLTVESDDSLYALLCMLEESGVKATLKFCTRKLELLHTRGRTDILEKLGNHEFSFHTTNHSIHPLPSEYLDQMGFRQGAKEFHDREKPGFDRLSDLCGQNLTSYGQPGYAWAPHVFPALRKWGVPTYLDAHDILGIDGQPFWYGGVLCFSKLNNLSHLVKDGSEGAMIRAFDNMNTACKDTVFFSIYDHPTEFSSSIFWDEVNFQHGRNPFTYQPAPLRTLAERDGLINQYREFIAHTRIQPDVEYVTALEAMRYEQQRMTPITAEALDAAIAATNGEANYSELGGAYLSASELLGLMARRLTGRMLVPELIYGPEEDLPSHVNGSIRVSALAEAVFSQADRVLGFKQLPVYYRVDGSLINPVDAFATLAAAIRSGAESLELVHGRLAAADHVDRNYQFGGAWILWADDFKAQGIIEHTALQTWTLKPAVF